MQSILPLRTSGDAVHRKASRQDTKRRNLQTVLRVVAAEATTSRADVARITSLTRATVSTLVGELIDDDLIVEAGLGKSIGGKPPTLIRLNTAARDLVVADLTSTPFRGAILDLGCEPIGPILTAPQTGDHQADLDDLLTTLIDRATNPILGIGLASPGVISDAGTVIEASNLGWHNHPLGGHVQDWSGLPVTVINDAHASAVAARHRLRSLGTGVDRPDGDLLLLRISTGVGAGIVLGGELHLGSHRAAGEIGHVVIDQDGKDCRCGNRGCVETIASSDAIYEQITGARPSSADWDVQEVELAFGVDTVSSSLARAGTAIGVIVSYLVNALDISQIAISMQPDGAADRLAKAAEASLMPRVLPALRADMRIDTVCGDDLALVGVASRVVADELGLIT